MTIPPHLSKALDAMGIVLLVKKPKPVVTPQQATGWKPNPDQQEPPF